MSSFKQLRSSVTELSEILAGNTDINVNDVTLLETKQDNKPSDDHQIPQKHQARLTLTDEELKGLEAKIKAKSDQIAGLQNQIKEMEESDLKHIEHIEKFKNVTAAINKKWQLLEDENEILKHREIENTKVKDSKIRHLQKEITKLKSSNAQQS